MMCEFGPIKKLNNRRASRLGFVWLVAFVMMHSRAAGDLVDLSIEELTQEAGNIVVGKVIDVQGTTRFYAADDSPHRAGDADDSFEISLAIKNVEKGAVVALNDVIRVSAWQLRSRTGGPFAYVTAQGHRVIPDVGQSVRVYFSNSRSGPCPFEVVLPNGIQPVDGQELRPFRYRPSLVTLLWHSPLFIWAVLFGSVIGFFAFLIFRSRRQAPRVHSSARVGAMNR